MANEVIMPKAGMSMETGTVVKWFKNEGDFIETGEPLLEIETDKVNMEVESFHSGTVIKILAQSGDVIPVTQVIGYIGEKGEEVSASLQDSEISAQTNTLQQETPADKPAAEKLVREGERIPATPLAKRLAQESGISLVDVTPSGRHGEVRVRDISTGTAKKATPLAKKIAAAEGINLNDIEGSGSRGKVFSDDVLGQTSVQDTVLNAAPLTGMRKVIAQRMLQSHTEIPPVTLNTRADVTELTKLRKQINASQDTKITFNDFVLCAVSRVFAQMKQLNISYADGGIVQNDAINIGFAVALENGLIVPVIRSTDKMSLSEISTSAKQLANKARQGGLMPDDYSGGTFTVSNLGMYGISSFTPIINQPEAMILGVCAIEQQLVMDDEDKIEKRLFMGLSLTFDHRAMDGAQSAVFLQRVVALLENPLFMLTQ